MIIKLFRRDSKGGLKCAIEGGQPFQSKNSLLLLRKLSRRSTPDFISVNRVGIVDEEARCGV